jgi:hypothetical protein
MEKNKNKKKTIKELMDEGIAAGSASMFIDLTQGKITVTHGTIDDAVLHEVDKVKEGSWKKLWEAIRAIESID